MSRIDFPVGHEVVLMSISVQRGGQGHGFVGAEGCDLVKTTAVVVAQVLVAGHAVGAQDRASVNRK